MVVTVFSCKIRNPRAAVLLGIQCNVGVDFHAAGFKKYIETAATARIETGNERSEDMGKEKIADEAWNDEESL